MIICYMVMDLYVADCTVDVSLCNHIPMSYIVYKLTTKLLHEDWYLQYITVDVD